ncbi:CBS domain-containing protein [Pseudaeromonas paramecii]|uniref:CBS domain-containing protein n=1 Tax=Pseudaeromonas paramecii TaxID=2138166 RepID=A0ABP8QH87_9GAMM
MLVRDIMRERVASVGMDDKLETVREIFAQAPFHHLLVLEDDKLVGIVSDKDLYRAISPYLDSFAENQRDRDTLSRKVHQIMSREPVTVSPELGVRSAADLMLARGISCLPVLEQGQVVGILTWRDLLRAVLIPQH